MKFFSYDSRFSQVMLKVCYACCLNLLWAVCSIPVFTIGAATAAMYDVSLKIVRDEEYYIAQNFFRAFRSNFKQATQIWLILLGIGAFLAGDGYLLYHLRAASTGPVAVFWTLVLAVVIAAAVVYVIVLLYVFPLVASVKNTNRAMLVNSFLIGTHYLFATILLFAVHFAMFFLVVRIFTPLIIFGEGACALICAFLLNRILISVSYNPEEDEEDETEETDEADETEETDEADGTDGTEEADLP